MHINSYNHLKNCSQSNAILGVSLPNLKPGKLSHSAQLCSADEVIQKIKNFAPTDGWVMYRDQVQLSASEPNRNDFIEGQWCNNNNSVHVQLVANNQYQVVQYMAETELNDDDTNFVYKEQRLHLRNHLNNMESLDGNNCAKYLIWYQIGQKQHNLGKWIPVLQQFVGFANDKHTYSKEQS